jgi:hypothetical protein
MEGQAMCYRVREFTAKKAREEPTVAMPEPKTEIAGQAGAAAIVRTWLDKLGHKTLKREKGQLEEA